VVADAGWQDPLIDRLPAAWQAFLGPEIVPLISDIGQELSKRSHTETILPAPHQVFRALETPPEQVRVIIVGQDPYPAPGHATGLAFSVPEGTWPLPPTLRNILRELGDDTGHPPPRHGNLRSWQRQGVLLLNRHLTTVSGHPCSHQRVGWGEFTRRIVSALAALTPPPVIILWGKQAAGLAPIVGAMPTISSPHPSPLSAARGFFGSAPFTQTNQYLRQMGREPIDWRLDPVSGCTPG
jgi:uracil-DNA glycosylase